MTRVLVTGATGFVGGRLARRLCDRGDDVVAIVRTPSDGLHAIGVEQILGGFDAIDEALLSRVDAVAHVAGSTERDLEAARAVNQAGTRRLVDHALAAGTPRFVHVSSTAVYDLHLAGPIVDESTPLVAEGAPPSPLGNADSANAVSRAEAEAEVARGIAAGLSAAILRSSAVLGAGPTSFFGTRLPARLRDGSFQLPHPATTLPWIHVDDLVDAIIAALDRPVTATVNVVGGHATFGAYFDAIRQIVPVPPDPVPSEPTSTDQDVGWHGRYADHQLRTFFGFEPTRSFTDAITEIADWWNAFGTDARPGSE